MVEYQEAPAGIVIAPRRPLEALARMLVLHLETELRLALGAAGVQGKLIEFSPTITKATVAALRDAWRQGFEVAQHDDDPTNPCINIKRVVADAFDEK